MEEMLFETTNMPNIKRMDELLVAHGHDASRSLRMFVQKNSDLSADDIAKVFCAMDRAAENSPYHTFVDF